MSSLNIAILTCSDTRSLDQDTAGAALAALCAENGWAVIDHRVVADDHDEIARSLESLADDSGADVVLTCGGTGFSTRDVTPEATQAVCDRMAPGIAEAMRIGSLAVTRRAMLSRAASGLRGTTLIVNLPGSRKAATECFGFISDQLEHAHEMVVGGGH